MRLRRAVLKISAKSSVPPSLPFHKNRSLLTPSQSTLPQLLIPPHFNSFRSNVYKNPEGGAPPPTPKIQPVTRHAPAHARQLPQPQSLHTLTSRFSGYPRGVGSLSVLCELCALCVKIPIPTRLDLSRYAQAEPHASSLSLFTTHHPLLTRFPSFQGKIYPFKSRSHHV